MPSEPPDPPPPSVRAQILATEHWSLLATRSTAQSEVLTRITIMLTFTSATAVSLALVGQATRFDERFETFAIVLLVLLFLIGTLTSLRVHNASEEDMIMVIAMNRLRAAYVALDPGVARYFVSSTHDDSAGVMRTYNYFTSAVATQLLGSAGFLVLVVNSAVGGVLAAIVATAAGAGTAGAVGAAVMVGLVHLGIAVALPFRRYLRIEREYRPMFPTPGEADGQTNER